MDRANFANFLVSGEYGGPRSGRAPADRDRHQPALDQATVFGPRRDFLADVATLVPVDSVESVEITLKQDRFFDIHIAHAIGDTKTYSGPVVLRERGFREGQLGQYSGGIRGGQDQAATQIGRAWIDERDAVAQPPRRAGFIGQIEGRGGVLANYGEHGEIVSGRKVDFGAQLEPRHARYEFINAPRFAVEDQAVADFGYAKVVQIFALRRQQGAIGGVGRRYPVDILRNQTLEEHLAVGACNRHQPALQFHISYARHLIILPRFMCLCRKWIRRAQRQAKVTGVRRVVRLESHAYKHFAMEILFIGPTRIGDAVLSSGLVQHLSETYPRAAITVACGAIAAPLYAGLPNLARVIPIVKKPAAGHWFSVWRQVVGTRWSLVVDLRRSIIPWTIWVGRRFVSGPAADAGEHRVVSLARTLGLAENPPAPCLWTLDQHRQASERLIPDDGPVLAIAPTANWRGKIWRGERFVELIERLTNGDAATEAILPNARVAIFGGPGEAGAAATVLEGVPDGRRINLVGRENLPTVAACLKRCALFVGNDSGLMHMAAAARIPTIGLFGPSRPENYGPWGELGLAVRTEEAYEELVGGPGYDHRTTGPMMDSLSVDSVVEATVALWRQRERIAAQ